jgi:hypothetical protein
MTFIMPTEFIIVVLFPLLKIVNSQYFSLVFVCVLQRQVTLNQLIYFMKDGTNIPQSL